LGHFCRIIVVISLLPALLVGPAYPCTTLLLPQSPGQVVATNMDWATGQGLIFVNKRDVRKQSVFIPAPQTPLAWTSKYMSVTFSQSGREFPWEGMNEKGLSVNVLQLPATQLARPDSVPAVNGLQWVQYILDTSATTSEAIANAQSVRVGGSFANTQHYFVCDAGGSCATVEYIFQKLVVHQGASLIYPALANSGYQKSANNLQQLLTTDTPSQILALPKLDSLTRFAKAAALSMEYTPGQDEISYAFSALSALKEGDTQWSIVFSLAQQSIQYKTAFAPAVKLIDLTQFDPKCSSPVMFLHVNSPLSGNVSSSFLPYASVDNDKLVSSNTQWSPYVLSTVQGYPDTTQCMETSTTLGSSPNPASVGQAVALTANVSGGGSAFPTGTVVFQNGAVSLGSAALDPSGTALLTTAALPVGTDSLTAVYSGDSVNGGSSSAALNEVINPQAAQITLTSSQNPAPVNTTVTFTAVVTPQYAGTPTGSVTFSIGGTAVATVPLSNGHASYSRTLTVTGPRVVTASYSGDASNQPSNSLPLNQVAQ